MALLFANTRNQFTPLLSVMISELTMIARKNNISTGVVTASLPMSDKGIVAPSHSDTDLDPRTIARIVGTQMAELTERRRLQSRTINTAAKTNAIKNASFPIRVAPNASRYFSCRE